MAKNNLPKHLTIGSDGVLYRVEGWQEIRTEYRNTFSHITTVSKLKATLRNGAYAWPGGYPLYFITNDGGSLSFDTVRRNFRHIAHSIKNGIDDGWRVVYCDINYEDPNLYDDHSGVRIECAYCDI